MRAKVIFTHILYLDCDFYVCPLIIALCVILQAIFCIRTRGSATVKTTE